MGCLKLHTENNYTALKVVYGTVNTRVLEKQERKNTGAFLEVVYRNAQGSGGGENFSLAGMYMHFQIGGGSDYHINASSIDFSGTSQKQLRLAGMKPGDMRSVNLFKSGINSNSLALGKVDMVYKGNNQFAIQPNIFDFNIEWQNGFTWRNAGTVLGGAVNYNLFPGTPFSPLVPLIFGGPYNVIFNGTTTIPR